MAERLTLDRWLTLAESERLVAIDREPDRDGALVHLGDDCERMTTTNVAVAIQSAQQLVNAAPDFGRARTRLLRALTTALAYAGRHEESLAAADAAIRAAEASARPVDAARAAVASLHPLTKLGRVDDALSRGTRARDALLAAGEPKLAARADINLGNIRKSTGHVTEAIAHLERARALLADDAAMVAHAENTLGETHLLADDFGSARRSFAAAASHFSVAGQRFAAAIVEGNLADLAAQEGRLQDSLRHFEIAKSALEKDTAHGHLARLTAEEAEVLATLGAPQEALRALDQAIALLDSMGPSTEATRARLARSRVLAGLGRHDDARTDGIVAETSASMRGDLWLARVAQLLVAELALPTEPTRTRDLAGKVLADESARALDRIVARHHLARAMAALGETQGAHSELDHAITTARDLGHTPLLADLLVARATLARDTGAAIRDLLEAVDLIERIRASLSGHRVRATWTGARLRAFEALALAQLAHGTPEGVRAAFDAVERSKSRALLDLVQRVIDREIGPAESTERSSDPDAERLRGEFERLRHHLSALYSRWESEGTPGERRSVVPTTQLRRAIRTDEAELDRLAARLAARGGETSLWAMPLSPDAIQQRILPTEVLVEYFVADGELMAFVVTSDSIQVVRRLGSYADAMAQTTAALFQMRRATRLGGRVEPNLCVAARTALGALHRTLVRPLEAALGSRTSLVAIPHGALHGVPFHALYDDRTDSYLIDRMSVRMAPSATLAHARSRKSSGGVLVVGAPDESAPAIAAEAHAVTACWPDARVLSNAEATASRVLTAAPRARIIHLACHGRFSESMPNASGLRLADRWVSIREITDLELEADLVVLAGCETGRAALEPGDEAIGLPRSFIAAGAASVVMSLWPVRDDAALASMTALHRRLAQARAGDGVARVVRETMLERRESDPHPAYWGAFGLVGSDSSVTITSLQPDDGRAMSS